MDDEQILLQYIDESLSNLAEIDRILLTLEQEPQNLDLLQALYRIVHSIKGSTGFFPLSGIEKIIHELETLLQTLTQHNKQKRQELIAAHKFLNLFFAVSDHLKLKMEELRANRPEDIEIDFELLEQISSLRTKFKNTSPKKNKKLSHLQQQALADLRSETNSEEVGTEEEIKLDEKIIVKPNTLEAISELNSELVLARNQMSALLETMHDSRNPLFRIYNRIDSLSQRISERINKIRLQPFSMITEKLQRIVRDLAIKLGKEVSFQIKGEAIELDRQVLENLKDPLLHLIRNSLDHGIEAPAEREAAGKEVQAQLSLEAELKSNQILIRVSDDGRGIDLKKLIDKAIEKNIISSEEAELMTDEQAYSLIFSPGFSTKEQVTDISGRGVGLDVVKANLTKINGMVNVKSQLGEGTSFELIMPLTFISDSSLVFEIAGAKFAITRNFVKSINVLPEGFKSGDFLEIRDEQIELIDLAEVVSLNGTRRERLANLEYIILETREAKFALLIDSVLDLQNVVVKNLPTGLSALNIYSGSTILADGIVALLLDPEKLYLEYKQKLISREPKPFLDFVYKTKRFEKLVSFHLGDFCFAFDYGLITEITGYKPLTRLPGSATEALIGLHDNVVMVKDLAKVFNVKSSSTQSRIDIVLEFADHKFAIQADDIDEIFLYDEDEAELIPETEEQFSKFSHGVYTLNEKPIHLLDEFKILSAL